MEGERIEGREGEREGRKDGGWKGVLVRWCMYLSVWETTGGMLRWKAV